MARGQKTAVLGADQMANAVIISAKKRLRVESPSKVFAEIGTWLGVGLGNGITKNSKVAILASANMGDGVEEAVRDSLGVHSESKIFNDIGSWVPTSLGSGLDNTKDSLLQKAKELGIDTSSFTIEGITTGMGDNEGAVTEGINSLLEMLTSQTNMKNITSVATEMGVNSGLSLTNGVASGIDTGSPKVGKSTSKVTEEMTEMTKDAFQILKEAIDKRKEYNLITTLQEIALWQAFTKQYVAGTELRMKGDKELGRVRYEASKTWIDKEKYYKRLSLTEELEAWQRVQARYKEGHEYRLEAEREMFRLKEEIWQAEYQHALDYVDDEKFYGRMDPTEELAVLKQIRAMTKENSDERKKSDREIYTLEKEINAKNLEYENKLKQVEKDRTDRRKQAADEYYQKEKEVNDQLVVDIAALKNAYESAVDARAKSLYATYGLFDKVEIPNPVDGLDLVKNLEDQTKAFDDWQNNIGVLAAKGVDEGLIQELRDMGPKASVQIAALNSLSDVELDKYVALWQQKGRDATEQAERELQSMKNMTTNKIIEITNVANAKLAEYRQVWFNTWAAIDADTKVQMDALAKEWTDSIGEMSTNGIDLIKKFKLDWFNEIDEMISTTTSKLAELQKTLSETTVPNIGGGSGGGSGGGGSGGGGSGGGGSLYDKADGRDIGGNWVAGVATGIRDNISMATSAADNLNRTLSDETNNFWGIASPAKKTIETGRFIVMGLAEGLRKFSTVASSAAEGVGVKAVSAIGSSITAIPDLFDEMDEITLTPVVDLSNIKAGVRDANALLGNMSGLDLSTTMGLLPSTISTTAKPTQTVTPTQSSTKASTAPSVTYVQNNYSPTALSRLDIYRQTKNQLLTLKG